MIQSKTLKGLALAMAGGALVLGGCGDDGGGGGGSSAQQPTFDGTGTEALGWYVAEVTNSTGLYGADGHYAPAGLTRHLYLYISGGSLYVGYTHDMSYNDYDGDVELLADPDTETYTGSTSWQAWTGFLGDPAYEWINEDWTVSFSGDTVTLTVDGVNDGGPETGTVTFVMRPLATVPTESYSYGKVTSHTDSRANGVTTWQGLYTGYDSSYTGSEFGAYGEIAPDASYFFQGNDYFWAPLYRAGNSLRGGQLADSDYQDDETDLFATVQFNLNGLGNLTSASVKVQDFVADATWSVSTGNFHSEDFYNQMYLSEVRYDITIDTVTEGGELESAFDLAGELIYDELGFNSYGRGSGGIHFYDYGPRFWGGYVSPTKREIVAWDGRYYDYYAASPGYDFDGDAATEERLTITINYDDTTMPAIPVSGSLKLEVYDADGAKIDADTETMTFTISGPGWSL